MKKKVKLATEDKDIIAMNNYRLNEFKITHSDISHIKQRKLLGGIGFNDSIELMQPIVNGKREVNIFYLTWINMIRRCYSENSHKIHPTYKSCTVCDEWTVFSNFKEWMECRNWKDNHLDKDILKRGNKIYSPETCCFVPQSINNLLTDSASSRGRLPKGVNFDKNTGKYKAQISINGKKKHIGRYSTIKMAELSYKNARLINIKHAADKLTNLFIIDSLYRIAEER